MLLVQVLKNLIEKYKTLRIVSGMPRDFNEEGHVVCSGLGTKSRPKKYSLARKIFISFHSIRHF